MIGASSGGPPEMSDFLKGVRGQIINKAGQIMELTGAATIKYLQSYLSEQATPLRIHGADLLRFKHPGQWGDISFELRDSYYYEVTPDTNGWKCTLGNSSEHASIVEDMIGFWVLEGVTDVGGPAQRALLAAIKRIQPSWLKDQPDVDFTFDTFLASGIDEADEGPDFPDVNFTGF